MRKLLVGAASLALAWSAFGGTASAAPHDTPNSFTGACNMVMSWPGVNTRAGQGVQPGGGMERGMSVDNAKGNDGMNLAVEVSGGYCP